MRFLLAFLMVFGVSTAFAQNNPFARCEGSPNNVVHLRCQISLVDTYLYEKYGEVAMKVAKDLYDKECRNSGNSPKLDPELRMLVSLDCEFKIKVRVIRELARLAARASAGN